jgi:site-specific DNA-methyltransferase (adenine-specific)
MQLIHGDCLVKMKDIPDKSIDMILCDLPYGTTACKWDTVIPFELLWAQYKRVIKKGGAIVLFGNEPFASALRMSNIKEYKYDWVWNKITARGHLVAKIRPMQQSESISVFGKGKINYYPIMEGRDKPITGTERKRTDIMGGISTGYTKVYTHKYPKTLLTFKPVCGGLHPTQKPVPLLEYLIRTYTKEGEVVLDNCMGSGSTGVACINTKRNFIGIEKDDKYFEIAKKRIEEYLTTAST